MNPEKYQIIELVLSDGRVATFSGPYQINQEDEKNGVRVVNIRVHEGRPLPPDYSFGPMEMMNIGDSQY